MSASAALQPLTTSGTPSLVFFKRSLAPTIPIMQTSGLLIVCSRVSFELRRSERTEGAKKTMSIPDYQSLMLPVLVDSSKGEVHIGAVVDELANQLGLSQEERSELLPSGQQTVFSNPCIGRSLT